MIGWQRDKFRLIKQRKIIHEDLVDRYDKDGEYFKRGNVGNICLLEHIQTGGIIAVVNTHLYWNPKFDFVKYGQAFWLLLNIANFLTEFDLSLDTVPLVMCGDFNSDPKASSVHMILNKDYRITENSGRNHYRTGVKAYRTSGTQ